MKHLLRPHEWSITGRLVLVATAPLLLMILALSMAVYITSKRDVETAVVAHGELLAQALAETSRYGVVSGDTDALERSAKRFLSTDRAIASIQILDDARRTLVTVRAGPTNPTFVFERSISSDVATIDVFSSSQPHTSTLDAPPAAFKPGRAAGFVIVCMSADPIRRAQLQRLGLAAAAMLLSVAISGALGLYLAQLIRVPLGEVMAALREIRQGRLEVQFARDMSGEMGELQSVIEEMARGLSMTRQQLEHQVAQRTEELQRVLAHSHDVVEEERRRISVELHDQLGAELLTLKMRAAALFARGRPPLAQDKVEEIATAITAAVDQLYGDARQMVKRLRPEVLDTLGLRAAITEAVRNFNEAQTACQMALEIDDTLPRFPDRVSIVAYRAVQEAMNNIVKHSGATRARIILRHSPASDAIHIEVSDNGRGFDTSARAAGLGLLGMRERVSAIKGTIRVQSEPGRGTRVAIDLPARA